MLIAIDPGIRGAIARLNHADAPVVRDMPIRPKQGNGKVRNEVDPKALQAILRELVPADERGLVVMEALNTFAGGSVQTMGSLEATKAVITTVCELSGFDVAFVSPKAWQSFFGIKRTATEDTKAQSLRLARQFFGQHLCPLAKHDGRADALLIARYAQRNLV
ncbi:hypothetical protein [Paraburkholderia caballeronis]|uniref:hypothetical protein n=1 Tax=Paraburkholderia caballeronis TaxID=416943 RepID=UPI0010667615|nr:hypothetical protein [Paraburkholderia caballeronis]TDV06044.1 hypothetical protein C7408_12425 [Paraburkholderia caballeronis]TDV09584.1 hypothetical protein C7406_12625 [Paraburkholderia caballeronis]TDV21649.1 hypothetical protein C7404_12125 [Paraburkholderia caballeronis]